MKIRYFAVIFLLISTFSFAQTLTITDSTNGEPLILTSIISYKPYVYTTTNSKGQANISEFTKCDRIEISMLGYKTRIVSYDDLKETGFQLVLLPLYVSMDEIVISATRWKQHSDQVSSNISVQTQKKILFNNPQTSADLLAHTGKVFIQKSQQGGGSPMIRGFATNRLLYTIDGVRMNTAIFRAGNIQNVISLDPLSIEKNEVMFGPGSVIYGSDAIGGVMSFQTHTPQLSSSNDIISSGTALFRYETANKERTAHFHLNAGGKKWAMVSSLSFNLFDDLKMGSHGPEEYVRPYYVIREDDKDIIIENKNPEIQTPSGYNQYNLMQKIRFKPSEKWDFNYGFHYSTTTDYSRYDYHLRTKNDKPRYGEWYYGPQIWSMNHISANYTAQHLLFNEFNISVAYQFFEESRVNRDFNKTTRYSRIEKVNAVSTNLDFQKSFTDKDKLYYGFEYVYDDVNSTGTDENILTGDIQKGPSRYPMSNWSSMAAYATNHYQIDENFNLQTGIRYNQYIIDARFDTTFYPFPFTKTHTSNGALTGSIGLVYKPVDRFEVFLNTSTAFRAPNIDDMGKIFDSEPGSVVVPNPDLKAEYAYNVDLGVIKMFNKNVKIQITGFYTYLDHAIVRRDFTLNGESQIMYDGELSNVLALQNAAKATVYGFQAGIETKFENGLGFETNINYQKGEEELDNGEKSPSRHAAPAFGNLLISYQKNKYSLQLNTIVSAKKTFDQLPEEEKAKTYIYAIDNNGNPYSPAWFTVNFKSSYQLTKNVKLSAGVENITDQRYRPYSSGIAGAGRNFTLSVRTDF